MKKQIECQPFKLLDLMPDTTPLYMASAWVSFILFAIGNDEMVAAYRRETGDRFVPGRSPIESMIDDSTGALTAFFRRFIQWANEQWGELD